MGWVSRYRHGRGFGVHSPFAYRLITEVLREKLPYYDWDRIKGKQERLLYRLACRFRPETVSAPAPLADIVRLAESKTHPTSPGNAAFVVMDSCDKPSDALAAVQRGAILIIFCNHHKRLVDSILPTLADLGYGMVFDNESDTVLIVANPKLPFQVFKTRF